MKKIILSTYLVIAVVNLSIGQTKFQVVDANTDCLYTYNYTYQTLNYQYLNDINECGLGLVMNWMSEDPFSSFLDIDCGWEALDRFYTNVDNAADQFIACSGLVITN